MICIGSQDVSLAINNATSLYIGDKFIAPIQITKNEENSEEINE